jgi:hypothetical protein
MNNQELLCLQLESILKHHEQTTRVLRHGYWHRCDSIVCVCLLGSKSSDGNPINLELSPSIHSVTFQAQRPPQLILQRGPAGSSNLVLEFSRMVGVKRPLTSD